MHNAFPVTPINYWRNSTEGVWWPYYIILGVPFDSKLIFEKHLLSVSRAASQRLGISKKSCRVFHDRSILWKCFRGFVLPVLECCSAVWCSAADTHLRILDRALSGGRFLTGGMFEGAILCMLYKIRCNPVHPLNGALPGQNVSVRVTHVALVAQRYTYEPLRCRTTHYRRILFPSQCRSGTILHTPYSMVWDCWVLRAVTMLFFCIFFPFSSFYFAPSLLSVHRLV